MVICYESGKLRKKTKLLTSFVVLQRKMFNGHYCGSNTVNGGIVNNIKYSSHWMLHILSETFLNAPNIL